jgi:hypothetical protein
MNKVLVLVLLLLFIGCSDKPVKWVANGTTVEATKYRLDISDSSKILVENSGKYRLLSPHDSLIVNKFNITYADVDSKVNLFFRTLANQQVKNTLNPKVTEYYQFSNGNVLLLGYSTNDSLKPYTIFEPPLTISPKEIMKEMKTSGVMKTFLKENNSFDEGFKTNMKINELKEIKLKNGSGIIKTYSLREITLSRDARVSYGENNLIMPEAIMLRTKLLVDLKGNPIAEWSVKVEENIDEADSIEKENLSKTLYIDFIKYKTKTGQNK